jgi:hypothetical protein
LAPYVGTKMFNSNGVFQEFRKPVANRPISRNDFFLIICMPCDMLALI